MKLAQLYRGALSLGEVVQDKIIEQTEGVSAAFIKELMRRISQRVIEDDQNGQIVAKSQVIAALDEMIFDGGALNAQLLGVHQLRR